MKVPLCAGAPTLDNNGALEGEVWAPPASGRAFQVGTRSNKREEVRASLNARLLGRPDYTVQRNRTGGVYEELPCDGENGE